MKSFSQFIAEKQNANNSMGFTIKDSENNKIIS